MKRSLQIGLVVLSLFGLVASASAGGNKNGGNNNGGNRNGGNSGMRQQGGSSDKVAPKFNRDSLKKIAHPNGSRNNGEKQKHQDNFASNKPQLNSEFTKIATAQQMANQRPSWNSPNNNSASYTRPPVDGRVQTPDQPKRVPNRPGYVWVNDHFERVKVGDAPRNPGAGSFASDNVRDHRDNAKPTYGYPGYGQGYPGHHGRPNGSLSNQPGGVSVTTTPGGNTRDNAIIGEGPGLHTLVNGFKDLITTEVGDNSRPAVVDHRWPAGTRDHRTPPTKGRGKNGR